MTRVYPNNNIFSLLNSSVLTRYVFLALAMLINSACTAEHSTTPSIKKDKVKFDQFFIPDTDLTLEDAYKKYKPVKRKGAKWFDYRSAAKSAIKDMDYKSAITLMNESIKLNPNEAKSYLMRGRARHHSFAKTDDLVVKDLELARKMGETDEDIYKFLSVIYDKNGDQQKAIKTLSEGIKHCWDRELFISRASLYTETGRPDKALEDYNALLKKWPDFFRGHLLRGQLHEKMKSYDEAVEDYRKAGTLEGKGLGSKLGSSDLAYKASAKLLSRLKQHKEAVKDLTRAIELNPGDDELMCLRGEEYIELKEYKKALVDLNKAIATDPRFARKAYEARSKLYGLTGKEELAKKDLEKAKQLKTAPAEKPLYELKNKATQ